jgi:hypothetical protein
VACCHCNSMNATSLSTHMLQLENMPAGKHCTPLLPHVLQQTSGALKGSLDSGSTQQHARPTPPLTGKGSSNCSQLRTATSRASSSTSTAMTCAAPSSAAPTHNMPWRTAASRWCSDWQSICWASNRKEVVRVAWVSHRHLVLGGGQHALGHQQEAGDWGEKGLHMARPADACSCRLCLLLLHHATCACTEV